MKPQNNIIFATKFSLLGGRILIVASLVLLSLTSQAQQQRFIYGVAVGLGASTLTPGSVVGKSVGPLAFDYDQSPTHSLSVQAGGYARFFITPWLFAQSGGYYQYDYNSLPLVIEAQQPNADYFVNDTEHLLVDYQFHQIEVPVLLGAQIAQWVRVYAGPSWGLSLNTRTETATSATYQYYNDPVFRNVRLGVGFDVDRFELDIWWQKTLHNNSYFNANKPLTDPPVASAGTSIQYDNFNLKRMMFTIGYRLY